MIGRKKGAKEGHRRTGGFSNDRRITVGGCGSGLISGRKGKGGSHCNL